MLIRSQRAVLAGLALAAVFALRVDAHDPITTKVTWSKEIVRIVEARCAGCHRVGGVAPMALTTYEQVKPWAKAIKDETTSRRMPKWPAARGFGDFENDRSLSPFEIALIAAWADGGAPKGIDKDLPPKQKPTPVPRGALVFPRRQTPPAGEQRTFSVRLASASNAAIRGWQFTPNDAAIVQAEFSVNGTYLGNWVPPETEVVFPRSSGVTLPDGQVMNVGLTVWYRSARMQEDFPAPLPKQAPELKLVLGARTTKRVVQQEVACGATGAAIAGTLFALRPVSSIAAASMQISAAPRDGGPKPLLWARDVSAAYEPTYRLRDPLVLAPGSEVRVASDAADCRLWVSYFTTTTNGVVTTVPPR